MTRWQWSILVCMAVLAVVSGWAVRGQDMQQDLDPPDISPPELEERAQDEVNPHFNVLERVVRRFDFEERNEQPWDFPLYFHRVGPRTVPDAGTPAERIDPGAVRPGHPLFGRMGFSSEYPYQGAWCFGFELEGGSMTARIPPKVIAVLPGADYQVSAAVRTDGLTHARAQLVAMFYDKFGKPIPASRTTSPLLQTDGRWREVGITLGGSHENAADLVVELQLVQPTEFGSTEAGRADQPTLIDMSGSAWFDDVLVRHVPHIEIAPTNPGGIFVGAETPTITLTVSDVSNDDLAVTLRARDLNDRMVFQQTVPVGRRTIGREFVIPVNRHGWYSINVTVSGIGGAILERDIAFVSLPATLRDHRDRTSEITQRTARAEGPLTTTRFGMNLERQRPATLEQAVDIAHQTGARTLVLPVWDRSLTLDHVQERNALLRSVLDRFFDRRLRVILAIPELPDALARSAALDRKQVLEALAGDEATWLPYLHEILSRLGEQTHEWQIGVSDDGALASTQHVEARLRTIRRQLSNLVPRPTLLVPRRIEDAPAQPSRQRAPGVVPHVRVTHEIAPDWIDEFLTPWEEQNAVVTLETLPREVFSPKQRAEDFSLRLLHLWRAGQPEALVEPLWRVQENAPQALIPDPELGVLATLQSILEGATFQAEIPFHRGIQTWLASTPEGPILICWNEMLPAEDAVLEARLAHGAIRKIDCFGNEEMVRLWNGKHRIEVSELPIVIRDIDESLAQFRRAFAIVPCEIPSVYQPHERFLRVRNVWPLMVNGKVRFTAPEKWEFSPRTITFNLAPGETADLPFSITFSRAELIGGKTVIADIEIQADKTYAITHDFGVELIMQDVQASPVWQVVENRNGEPADVRIDYFLTNITDRAIALESFVRAAGYKRQRRVVSSLPPGQTAVRTFLLVDGVSRLAGESILIGVTETLSGGRVNQSIDIPPRAMTDADQ